MLSVICSLFFYLMAKGTIILLFILFIIASLLLGINIGKKIGNPESSPPQPVTINQLPTTNYQSPTITLPPTPESSVSATLSVTPINTKKTSGTSTFTDKTCGVSFSYPGSYLKQTSANGKSTIFTDPENIDTAIAVACAPSIPRPPVTSDQIEAITVDKIAATLYHDKNPEGLPRDEVILKNPYNDMEVIIAGFGSTYQTILKNLRFVQ